MESRLRNPAPTVSQTIPDGHVLPNRICDHSTPSQDQPRDNRGTGIRSDAVGSLLVAVGRGGVTDFSVNIRADAFIKPNAQPVTAHRLYVCVSVHTVPTNYRLYVGGLGRLAT